MSHHLPCYVITACKSLTIFVNHTDVLDVSGNPLTGTLPGEILFAAKNEAVLNFSNTELSDSVTCSEFFAMKEDVVLVVDCGDVLCGGQCCQCAETKP